MSDGKLTERITILERPCVLARVKELADESGTTPSAWIRLAVRDRLKTEDTSVSV